MLNAFTVDVEDYFHVANFADRIHPRQWDGFESRVVGSTQRVLRLLDRHQVRGTFFVLGWVAERHPQLVREIAAAGHEIACHGYWHQIIYRQTRDEFAADLRLACSVLQQITGKPVAAYRAPSFSITRESLWALEVLAAAGITHDSSIFPVHHDRYGIPGAPRAPHPIATRHGALMEFPPSVVRLCGQNLPVSGGGYFRLFPLSFTTRCYRRLNRQGQPVMFYIHPWELDSDQPRLPCSLPSRLRHYVNLARTERKLDRLLDRFAFGSITEVLAEGVESVSPAVCTECTL
jgi:polysaccharide deacetylase family protein (PEP-CTERM system associated)